ncbi:uncharacterized protein [Trachinotus anak]|uniref:uncharacterized protein isoform X1 n=1 Tax=Trachinotus anak TaxID=443729 RepID=UPI0039F1FFAF
MSGFTGIQVSLFLKLLLHLTAVSGQDFSSFAVRVGDEVTLPCMYDQVKCDSTIWIFTHSLYPTVELVVQGKIGEDAKSKSDRLSVTENCSLVIKNVTAADGGLYTCRQFKSGEQQDPDQSQVDLSVVTMTEQKVDDEVVLFCSVFTYQQCSYTVQWLPTGTDVDKDHTAVGTSQSDCLATVAFRTLHHNQSNYHQLFKCEVRNRDGGNMQLFAFSLQSTGEGQRNNTTSREFNATTQEARTDCSALTFIMLLMRVAELLLITVITVLLLRAAGNQRPADDNTVSDSVRSPGVMRSGPAASQVHNDEDEGDGTVNYENSGSHFAAVRLH